MKNLSGFLVVLSCIFIVASLNPVTAPVGGSVTIQCTHFLAQWSTKFFCRYSCAEKNILIQRESGKNPARRGRYSLHDKGSDFTVTIMDLRLSDSGTYICAVERLLIDNTYNYVTLQVIGVSTLAPAPASTPRPPTKTTVTDKTENKGTTETRQSTTDTSPETMQRSALSDSLAYVGAGLGALVLIFTVAMFIFIKLKIKRNRQSSTTTSPTNEPKYINYTTPNFSAQSDSVNYSSVVFKQAEVDYSSVQSQRQSNITDPDSVIYSTVTEV